jgi:small subunit ribosomal protein S20
MAHIKQQKKRNITSEKRRVANTSFRTSMKTAIKNVLAAVEKGDKEAAVEALSFAYMKLDKSITKGLHHKNFVANQKARLSAKVNSL